MNKTTTFNGKKYNLEQIKKKIENQWMENFDNIEVQKEFQAVVFSNRTHSVSLPLDDLDEYV